MFLGRDNKTNCDLGEINIMNQCINCLGIWVGNDAEICEQHSWTNALLKFRNTLLQWSKRKMAYLGKIVILKSLAIPKLTFLAMNTVVPQWVIKEINQNFFNLIWDSKEKIKRTTVIREIKHGGLNTPDIESIFMTLKSKWIERICAAEDNAHWPFYIENTLTAIVLELQWLYSTVRISK